MSDAVDTEEADYTELGTLVVEQRATAPDVLDVLIAGGGPGGTAAALRALELKLSVLVIDADELLKQIRDFEPQKPVVPDYGVRSDSKPFPPGGPMLTSLHFPETKAHDLVTQWRQKYRQYNVPARIGLEFTGLERGSDGIWTVKTWSHRARQEITYRARNVIIAVGGGVPRRFDIPGDLNGIRFRLDKANNFVAGPALVIGGGISAAEAVIAISNAKAQAGEPTAVYWAYRGEKLPRVAESKALGPAFYDSYVGNGNIRYLPNSEAAAVFPDPNGGCEYLLVRIDRKVIQGRPIETVHLEFAKERVVACIGGDLPFQLVESLGAKIPSVNDKRYMLVNEAGELSLPGVFLVGDARGGKHLRCTDFNDQSTYEWITASRNIKASMWEAVLAVETIAVRAGNEQAKMALLAAPAVAGKKMQAGDAPAAAAARPSKPAPAAAPAAASAAAAAPPASVVPPIAAAAAVQAGAAAKLESLLPDGTVEAEFALTKPTTTIGRSGADVSSPNDVHLANIHAQLAQRGDDYVLEDAGSDGGTWLRIQGIDGYRLAEGDLIWIGSQILMANRADGGWSVAHYNSKGEFQASYPVGDKGLFIGRGAGVPLDEHDSSLSRRHAQFRVDAQGLRVFDLASTNGTLVKLTGGITLHDGDEFRVGNRRFRFERLQAVAKLRPTDLVVDAPAPTAAPPPAAAASAGGAPLVTVADQQCPASFAAAAGQNVLQAFFGYIDQREPGCDHAKFHKKPLDWSCLKGTCGLCVVKVLEGADNLEPVGGGSPELDTLENKAFVEPDPQQFRLACLAKVKGPVKLGIVE
jgi:thioredoxin reductase/pSer/pThr/pTyr-binding forkhead associated (FHA) protein/ferredoxin